MSWVRTGALLPGVCLGVPVILWTGKTMMRGRNILSGLDYRMMWKTVWLMAKIACLRNIEDLILNETYILLEMIQGEETVNNISHHYHIANAVGRFPKLIYIAEELQWRGFGAIRTFLVGSL